MTMNYDPNDPNVVAALEALRATPARPKPKPKPPHPNPFASDTDRIEYQLDRIAKALENIAAVQDARAGMGGCC